MPKKRSTCTRCSMRRQKCDRNIPCARCIQNGEARICTTEWPDGYDPRIHRKYPKAKSDTGHPQGNPPGQPGYPTPVVTNITSPTSQTSTPLASRTPSTGAVPSQTPGRPVQDLEFITWGQAKLSEFNINGHYGEGALTSRLNLGSSFWQAKEDEPTEQAPLSEPARSAEMDYLQSLLPSKDQVFTMVQYHEDCLIWHHNSFNGPAFRRELTKFYNNSRVLNLQDIDWRWSALLFAILAGSSLCAPDSTTFTWGFSRPDKDRLSKQWYNAISSCLILGQFTSKYHIYSVQAIVTSSLSAHVLGYSKQQLSLLSLAINIARGLSLHRINPHTDSELDQTEVALTPPQVEALIQRETGRRIWWHLCGQDWFCTTSTRMYSIQKRHCTTTAPLHYNDETMKLLAKGKPAHTHYGNHLHRLAGLNVEFFEAMQDAQDTETEYNTVLRYDSKIRALFTEAPNFKPNSSEDGPPDAWVKWANRTIEVSHAHKIIKVNQFFLARSFYDPRYAYSRWATITASKTIIQMLEKAYTEASPSFWIDQAFIVTACINLVLDVWNRPEEDCPEVIEHLALIQRAVNVLKRFPSSAIATHGIHLLHNLSKNRTRKPEQSEQHPNGQAAMNFGSTPNFAQPYTPNKRQRRENSSIFQWAPGKTLALANSDPTLNASTIPNMTNPMQFDGVGDGLTQYPIITGDSDFNDVIGGFPQTSLEGNNYFEDVFNLDFF